MPNKKWTKVEIQHNMETDNKWLYRGLLAIYNHQTDDEQASEVTRHDNGIGFNGSDSPYLSYVAKFLQSHGYISGNHLAKTRVKMKKYAGQLLRITQQTL